jgi:hypothetical protein
LIFTLKCLIVLSRYHVMFQLLCFFIQHESLCLLIYTISGLLQVHLLYGFSSLASGSFLTQALVHIQMGTGHLCRLLKFWGTLLSCPLSCMLCHPSLPDSPTHLNSEALLTSTWMLPASLWPGHFLQAVNCATAENPHWLLLSGTLVLCHLFFPTLANHCCMYFAQAGE